MNIKRLIIVLIIVGPTVVMMAAYVGLVTDGTLPPPDLESIARRVGLGTATAAQIALALAIIVVATMAAIAPIIYAARANDIVTVLISLALTGSALGMLVLSRTVLDQISALIIYLANLTLSAVVYAAHEITKKA
ncbi:MAG TPA: hypothetical protein VFB23_04975 [Candidatus Acidoferrales bacterium]|nr:hypothetical protein [Candidatus Acidoferrales bacterium]